MDEEEPYGLPSSFKHVVWPAREIGTALIQQSIIFEEAKKLVDRKEVEPHRLVLNVTSPEMFERLLKIRVDKRVHRQMRHYYYEAAWHAMVFNFYPDFQYNLNALCGSTDEIFSTCDIKSMRDILKPGVAVMPGTITTRRRRDSTVVSLPSTWNPTMG